MPAHEGGLLARLPIAFEHGIEDLHSKQEGLINSQLLFAPKLEGIGTHIVAWRRILIQHEEGGK